MQYNATTIISHTRAEVAELADAPALGAGARKGIEVRTLSSAPFDSALRGLAHHSTHFAHSWSFDARAILFHPVRAEGEDKFFLFL